MVALPTAVEVWILCPLILQLEQTFVTSVTLRNATNYWVRSSVCFDQDVFQVQMSGELPGFGLSCYWEILVHT